MPSVSIGAKHSLADYYRHFASISD